MLSGQSTSIEFDGFGVDPDGDVVELDRIIKPARERVGDDLGGRRVDPLHERAGYRGQVVVPLPRRRRLGETGEGTVRVGVLGGQSNPSP